MKYTGSALTGENSVTVGMHTATACRDGCNIFALHKLPLRLCWLVTTVNTDT